ncbi:MAG: IS110 family transposase [Candidatus Aminicenantes bacterium]|nr:IS110 family transposase [Candidatus Aminicenantes bacterium]
MFRFFCGVDISKSSFHATLLNHQGESLFSLSFPMSSDGFQNFISSFSSHCPNRDNLLIGMESSSSYHLNLLSFLHAQNFNCTLINPILIFNFAKLSLRKTKTDKRDSSTIAEFLKDKSHTLTQQKSPLLQLRALARERERISSDITALKNEIKRLLNILFPEILPLINPFTASSLNLLLAFPSKDAILNATAHQIQKVFSPKKGRKPSASPHMLISAAECSIGLSSPIYENILKTKITLLITLQDQLKKTAKLLIQSCQQKAPTQMNILKSITGISDVTASHFLAEIENKHFSSYKKLIAYAGVDPSVYESGQSKIRGGISKRGNKCLRRVLYIMALSVIKRNHVFTEYFLKKRSEGKPFRMAMLAVIHKLIRTIHALLTKQIPFNPCHNSL